MAISARLHNISWLLALVFLPAAALACTCGDVSLEDELSGTDLVFSGKVIRHVAAHGLGGVAGWMTLPARCWKGSVSDTLMVYSQPREGACGYPFVVGKDYLIFAHLDGGGEQSIGRYWPDGTILPAAAVTLCSRTQPMKYAKNVLKQLGKPIWVRVDPDED